MLENILRELRAFPKIMVTGPQRSGTRIAARIIADALSYRFVDETEFGIRMTRRFFRLLEEGNQIVIQAPTMSSVCHMIEGPDVAIVFMMRPIEEILRSQARIGWGVSGGALSHDEDVETAGYFRSGPAAEIKYDVWRHWQKRRMRTFGFELPYAELKKSPLWLDAQHRGEFSWNRTE